MAVERDVLIERTVSDTFAGMKISWGGVFGGVLAGIGTLMLLSSLGIAIGISAVDPRDPDGSAIGTGAAIWTALTLLVALFVGGWASTRLSMLWERTTAMFEGALVWVLSLMLILYMAASGVSLIAGGVLNIAGQTVQTVGAAAGAPLDERGMSSGSVDEILARLRAPETASTLSSALGMPREQVASSLNDISSRVEASRDNPAQAAAAVRSGLTDLAAGARQNISQAAAEAKPEATTTAWVAFAALLLSLLAAIGGAAVGRRNVVNRVSPERA
jgi:ABC-type transport system involved in multi-copper enzyme maturation permease subunit